MYNLSKDIEQQFENARNKTENKRKMRELMETYGETIQDMENNLPDNLYGDFLLAGGRDMLELIQKENAQIKQPEISTPQSQTSSEEYNTSIEEEVEEEEIVDEKKYLDILQRNISPKNNTLSKGIEKIINEDNENIRKTMEAQIVNTTKKAQNNYQLGTLSAEFESRGNPEAIGKDNAGGYSYGKYQIASSVDTMKQYIKYLQKNPQYTSFAKKLNDAGGSNGAKDGTTSFVNTWIRLSKNQDFNKSQFQFIIETHLTPLLNSIKEKKILDIENRHPVIKDILYSMSVQHQGAAKIVNRALSTLKQKYKNIDDITMVKELYNQRIQYVKSLPESQRKGDRKITKREKENILKNRYPAEMQKALNFLK